jgi:RHS repeat-associated protein
VRKIRIVLAQIILFLVFSSFHANALDLKLPWQFIHDYLGNPVVVVNQAQNIQYQTYQDPWGNLEMSVGVPTSNPEFKFTDKEQDEDSDLYYFQARYYDDGRFLTRDSITLEDGLTDIFQLNPYQFNRNNPVKYKDDDGKIGWDATVDVLSFSVSLKDFKDKPDLINTASLAWDSVALLPVILGGAGVLKHAIPHAVSVVKNTVKETKAAKDFFKNAEFSKKVLKQMKDGKDKLHSFPEMVNHMATKYGKVTTKLGADGKKYNWLEMKGSYKGITGTFEYVKDSAGKINHRMLNPK